MTRSLDKMLASKYCPTIVFVSFENEFAPCGGLAAVMKNLPRIVAKTTKTILITPFFPEIDRCAEAYFFTKQIVDTGIAYTVRYGDVDHPVRILKYTEEVPSSSTFEMYFIQSCRFFLAPKNPYVYPGYEEKLLDDACFFCAAIPPLMEHLCSDQAPDPALTSPYQFIFSLQDWQSALLVETLPADFPAKCVLTMHNPYDQRLTGKQLGKLKNTPPVPMAWDTTVLQYTLPKMAAISTVSEHFAWELSNDPLQTQVFAPQLRKILQRSMIVGINNGNFIQASFPSIKDSTEIHEYKTRQRRKFTEHLKSKTGQDMVKKGWGHCDFSDPELPLFLVFGRDDPRQKGFDLSAQAIRTLLTRRGDDFARFVFTPIPGQYGLESLYFLQALAEEFPRSIIVLPFRMSVGYQELQASASYLLMSSLYEPFGGANEGYAVGVPVVARATGGLIQQVYPQNLENLPASVIELVNKYHGFKTKPTGFLFREEPANVDVDDWDAIIKAKFLDECPPGDPVDHRLKLSLFHRMVDACMPAIEQAALVYREEFPSYAQMILNGLELLHNFSWVKSAREYMLNLYQVDNLTSGNTNSPPNPPL